MSLAHHRTGRTHGVIHNELRRLCGGPVVAAADAEQLRARIQWCGRCAEQRASYRQMR